MNHYTLLFVLPTSTFLHLFVGVRRRTDRPAITDSMAMEAASNTHTCYYRRGFDMSVPLYPRETYLELEPIPPEEREFFLTVKVNMCPDTIQVLL